MNKLEITASQNASSLMKMIEAANSLGFNENDLDMSDITIVHRAFKKALAEVTGLGEIVIK